VVWALLPLKDFVNAKKRLSGVLSATERRRLFHNMVEDVLDVLAFHPGLEQTLIVSDDPCASLLAEHYGIKCWAEADVLGHSINASRAPGLTAVVDGTAAKLNSLGVESVMVIHGDLPLVSGDEIQKLLDSHQRIRNANSGRDVVSIVPDTILDGSNCMVCSPPNAIKFQYGKASFEKHQRIAAEKNCIIDVVTLDTLALDIDNPADLGELLSKRNDSEHRTLKYLTKSGIAERISMMIEKKVDVKSTTAQPIGEQAIPIHSQVDKREVEGAGLSVFHSKILREDPENTALIEISKEALSGRLPTSNQALALAQEEDTSRLMQLASHIRDEGFRNVITYSRKVFIPLTHLCRDVCHYCTFAQTPKNVRAPYMTVAEVLSQVREGEAQGCKEALLTLGEKPELRYRAAREALAEMGFESTLHYVAHVAKAIIDETGVLPHINAGCMTEEEVAMLRPVSASMGIMLESSASRLSEKGMPHYGSPDKDPEVRLQTIDIAGQAKVPFTSGILIGIGETRLERIESLLELRKKHDKYGHLQEIIIQNFRAKEDTKMSQSPEPDLNELLWTIAVARIVFGPSMSLQAPPNLSPGVLPKIIQAGINDWGGVSPVTPDYVNPEAPWPHVKNLAKETALSGKYLHERLTIYPSYAMNGSEWLDTNLQTAIMRMVDAEGFPRVDQWAPGDNSELPSEITKLIYDYSPQHISRDVRLLVAKAKDGKELLESEIVRLFQSRGDDFAFVCRQADDMRQGLNGDDVAYVVNRNINYTNICYFKCQFCAFSKGKLSENLRGRPYDLDLEEIERRCDEAWQRGATEVCMQGGIHPEYTGQTYIDILQSVKKATPDMHIHAFSPLEVWQGAATSNLSLAEFLQQLKDAGLDTLPGTAAEILDDAVRADLCPDKINTEQWLEVMEEAHKVGFRTTATIMYGHIEKLEHWAGHLLKIRQLQQKSGGFTEFVPLPFVHMEAPMYLKGNSRMGPTFREALLMHAVARLTLSPLIENIQTSWVKMGEQGVKACLHVGANDLGGTLMNETITRAAGADHGQECPPAEMDQWIERAGRNARRRSTVYGPVSQERKNASYEAEPLLAPINTQAKKYQRSERRTGDLILNNIDTNINYQSGS
jgi:FO synthase